MIEHEQFSPAVLALIQSVAKAAAAEGGEIGATRALERIGIHDEKDASRDIKDLRDLLAAFREARHTAASTAVRLITTVVLVFIGFAVWAATKGKLLE